MSNSLGPKVRLQDFVKICCENVLLYELDEKGERMFSSKEAVPSAETEVALQMKSRVYTFFTRNLGLKWRRWVEASTFKAEDTDRVTKMLADVYYPDIGVPVSTNKQWDAF